MSLASKQFIVSFTVQRVKRRKTFGKTMIVKWDKWREEIACILDKDITDIIEAWTAL